MIKKFSFNEEKSKEFIKFFYAEQRTNIFEILKGSGSSYWNKDDEFEVFRDVKFDYNGEMVSVCWKILYNKMGELLSIECLNGENDKIINMANDIIFNAFQHVVNNKRQKYFKRVYYLAVSGCNLSGEYWFNGFRFAPLFPEDNSCIINAERIVVIDQNIMAIDNEQANEIAVENAENYASLLSFIMDIELEKPREIEKYILEDDFRMKRMYTQIYDASGITCMPRKGEICATREFEGSIFDKNRYLNCFLVLPTESRKIINSILSEDVEFRDTVFKACKLYRIAKSISGTYPTATLSYECAAVESIVKNMKYDSFTGFMTKYAGANKKFYDFIYRNIRSGHFHAGEFPFLDFNVASISLDDFSSALTLRRKEDFAHNTMRYAVLKWLDVRLNFYGN